MKQRSYFVLVVVAAIGGLFLMGARQFEGTAPSTDRSIHVTGTSVVYGKPDYATVVIGVVRVTPTVMQAKSQSDLAMQRVQATLRKMGIRQEDIQTIDYQMYPVQEKQTDPRRWKVSDQIQVKIRQVDDVADVLDRAASAGASNISRVSFGVENLLALKSKARTDAGKIASDKAQELARLSNVSVGQLMSISESSQDDYGAQFVTNSYADYGGVPGAAGSGVLSGGQIAVTVREDVTYGVGLRAGVGG